MEGYNLCDRVAGYFLRAKLSKYIDYWISQKIKPVLKFFLWTKPFKIGYTFMVIPV